MMEVCLWPAVPGWPAMRPCEAHGAHARVGEALLAVWAVHALDKLLTLAACSVTRPVLLRLPWIRP